MRRTLTLLSVLIAASATATTFDVTRGDDGAGTGTLRWAIEQANATPGRDTINFPAIHLVQPTSALPAITESVWLNDSPGGLVIIDGDNAGAADGLVIRGNDSWINTLQIQNFSGDGVIVDGDNNALDLITVAANRNGMRINGDHNIVHGSQLGAPSSGLTGNREAGLIISAGASNNEIGRTPATTMSDGTAGALIPLPAFPPGPNSVLGNGSHGIVVNGDHNKIEANVIGAETTVRPNGGDGIVVNGASNFLANNLASYNRGHGITLNAPVSWSYNRGVCNGLSFVSTTLARPPAPRITSAINDSTAITIDGEIDGAPNTRYAIELQAPPSECDGSQARFLGRIFVTTDDNGFATFRKGFESPVENVSAFSVTGVPSDADEVATETNHDHRADIEIVTNGNTLAKVGEPMFIETRVTNHGPATQARRINVTFTHPANAHTIGLDTTSGTCTFGETVDRCVLGVVPAGETVVIHHGIIFKKAETSQYTARATLVPMPGDVDPNPANDSSSLTIMIPDARVRSVRH